MIRGFTAWRRAIALAVLLGFVPLASACFGSFNLTGKVYRFNKSVSPDKWLRWLMFLALNVIPIYAFATFIDLLFANSVEFWTGDNPVSARLEPQAVVGPHGEVATLTPVENGGRLVVTEPSGEAHAVTLLRERGGIAAYDDAGQLLGRVVGLASDEPHLVDLAATH